MSMMDSFAPQEELLAEASESPQPAAAPLVCTSPVVPSDFEDNENEEIKKICSGDASDVDERKVSVSAEPVISLT